MSTVALVYRSSRPWGAACYVLGALSAGIIPLVIRFIARRRLPPTTGFHATLAFWWNLLVALILLNLTSTWSVARAETWVFRLVCDWNVRPLHVALPSGRGVLTISFFLFFIGNLLLCCRGAMRILRGRFFASPFPMVWLVRDGLVWLGKGNPERALAALREILSMQGIPERCRLFVLIDRGTALWACGDLDGAASDWTEVAQSNVATPEQLALARYDLGLFWRRQRQKGKAIEAFSTVAEMHHIPTKTKAAAIRVRGLVWLESGELDKALADSTTVIEMRWVPREIRAKALLNRAATWRYLGEREKAKADLAAVTRMLWLSREIKGHVRAQYEKLRRENESQDQGV